MIFQMFRLCEITTTTTTVSMALQQERLLLDHRHKADDSPNSNNHESIISHPSFKPQHPRLLQWRPTKRQRNPIPSKTTSLMAYIPCISFESFRTSIRIKTFCHSVRTAMSGKRPFATTGKATKLIWWSDLDHPIRRRGSGKHHHHSFKPATRRM